MVLGFVTVGYGGTCWVLLDFGFPLDLRVAAGFCCFPWVVV